VGNLLDKPTRQILIHDHHVGKLPIAPGGEIFQKWVANGGKRFRYRPSLGLTVKF
jgi:hypothetical protein